MGIENFPIACAQCESAPCKAICPAKAISRDEPLSRVIVDYDRCIGCRMCIAICPFGCMSFDSIHKRVFKCELCNGDPMCVRFCQHDALRYVEADEQSFVKRKATAEKFSGLMHKLASAMTIVEQR
jgi:Fe-S-cluster-containing hydrogenase component 2